MRKKGRKNIMYEQRVQLQTKKHHEQVNLKNVYPVKSSLELKPRFCTGKELRFDYCMPAVFDSL